MPCGRAAQYTDPPPPPWTVAWLSGLINRQQGHLAEAEQNFRSVLEGRSREMLGRQLRFQSGLRGDQPSRRDALRPRQTAPVVLPAQRPASPCWAKRSRSFRRRSRSIRRTSAHTIICRCCTGSLATLSKRPDTVCCTPATSPTTTPAIGPSPRPEKDTPRPTMRRNGLPSIP